MQFKKNWQLSEFTYLACGNSLTLLDSLPDDSLDLVVTSPPYFIGKSYDESRRLEDFCALHESLAPRIARVVKPGGSICWQVGYRSGNDGLMPLDYFVHDAFSKQDDLVLRNRIIWQFGHGPHARKRFSGRHEVVLWYTNGREHFFDLDPVRVPQKYPGKKAYKGVRKGQYSGNPLGKNPGDVWDIPNVTASHKEKTVHPAQFPVGLPQRLIRALCPLDGFVFDPFVGSGSTGIAAVAEGRGFLGFELRRDYYELCRYRLLKALTGEVAFRPHDQPDYCPSEAGSVAIRPPHFLRPSEGYEEQALEPLN